MRWVYTAGNPHKRLLHWYCGRSTQMPSARKAYQHRRPEHRPLVGFVRGRDADECIRYWSCKVTGQHSQQPWSGRVYVSIAQHVRNVDTPRLTWHTLLTGGLQSYPGQTVREYRRRALGVSTRYRQRGTTLSHSWLKRTTRLW
jgi:hypothetical protein